MTALLTVLLAWYLLGGLLPLCTTRPHFQNLLAHGCAAAAGVVGIVLGVAGLLSTTPLTLSLASNIPHLTFAIRLDPLAAFFVLTISLVGLAASIYASGYVKEFSGLVSVGSMGSLLNGFFFLILWEVMSLLSDALVVTGPVDRHIPVDVRISGCPPRPAEILAVLKELRKDRSASDW